MATATAPAPKGRKSAAAKKRERDPKDCPDFTRQEVIDLRPLRERCRDLVGSETASGTDMMHAKSHTYLPQWEGEEPETYKVRSTLTELYGGLERCIVASRGLIFAKPPTLEDGAPKIIKEHWDDIDGMGTSASVFLNDLFLDGMTDGIVAIRVDYPKVADPKSLRLDQYQAMKLRPRWIKVNAEQIINWKVGIIDGEPTYTLMVIAESVDEDSGEFGLDVVDQYRVYRLQLVKKDGEQEGEQTLTRQITYQIWRKREINDVVEWYVYDDGEIVGPKRIPVQVGYLATPSAPLVAKPPLAALADLNLGHYRVSADRRWLMSIVHAPTPVIEGWTPPRNPDGTAAPDAPIKTGPGRALKLHGTATFRWEQADAAGLDSSKEEKADLVSQMAGMSIAFMSQEKRSQETATAHRINAMSQNASLAISARGTKDLTDGTVEIHCEFLGIDTPPKVTINTAYDEDVLDAPTITALNQLEKDANLTKGTLLKVLQRGKAIPEDIDIADEELALATEAINRAQQAADAQAAANANMEAQRTPPAVSKKKKPKPKKPSDAAKQPAPKAA